MTFPRLSAIALIFACATGAWFILGSSLLIRSGQSDRRLVQEVEQLWGGHHVQVAPSAWYETTREVVDPAPPVRAGMDAPPPPEKKKVTTRVALPLAASQVHVDLHLDQRQKGLLWYATYGVLFAATYRIRNPDAAARAVQVQFAFPSKEATYDAFVLRLNGRDLPASAGAGSGAGAPAGAPSGGATSTFTTSVDLPPAGEAALEVSYRSRGRGDWAYAFAADGISEVRDFNLTMTTDCDGIDFPAGSISPTGKTAEGSGYRLEWAFSNLIGGQRIAVVLPSPVNPGPMAAHITFFAPICLLFFVSVVLILGFLGGGSLHPMHYFFLSAAFFSFHLLLAYLVDHLNIHASFAIASAVSIALVITYLRAVRGLRFALLRAGLAQLVFLVLFSYSFFFEGYTGLTVTIGSIITLFVLMQATARLDWETVFGRVTESGAGRGPGRSVPDGVGLS